MISLIIPTRNRSELLAATLESLSGQTLPETDYEVIVVDNGSTDDTSSVISHYKSRYTNLTAIYASEPGLHVGRHAGLANAKGEFLVFADDDIEAHPSWLTSIQEAFRNPQTAMVGGNNLPLFITPPPGWLQSMWNKRHPQGYKAISALSVIEFNTNSGFISPNLVWGCNFSIRKSTLLSAGGFHPDGMPKELIQFRGDGETYVSNFVEQSGMNCVFHPGASIFHKVTSERMTHAYFYQRGYNQGISDSYTQLRAESSPPLKPKSNIFTRIVRYGLRHFMTLFESPDVLLAARELRRGHAEGFRFHQDAYMRDPELRAWVHKSTYL